MAKGASAYDRIKKYEARLFYEQSKAIPVVVKGQKDTILAQVTRHFENIVDFENATRVILNEESMTTYQYPAYLNFSRRIYSLVARGLAGYSLRSAVQNLVDEYVARGFTQAILERIRDEVWTIPAPSP